MVSLLFSLMLGHSAMVKHINKNLLPRKTENNLLKDANNYREKILNDFKQEIFEKKGGVKQEG